MAESLAFSNTHKELAYLRTKVLEAERRLERFGVKSDREGVIRDTIERFKGEMPNIITHDPAKALTEAEELLKHHQEIELEEMIQITEQKGVLHALGVVEKLKGWRLEDDFHDFLVRLIKDGLTPVGVKEKGPVFQALNMTLFEVILSKKQGQGEKPLGELIKSMEQLYAGLLSVASDKREETDYMVFELANPDGEEDTRAFVATPTDRKDLFAKQLLSIFPDARIIERDKDYNIFNEFGVSYGASAKLEAVSAYPLKTFEALGENPMNVILNSFTKIPVKGAGAAFQIIFKPTENRYVERYQRAIKEIEKGKKAKVALEEESIKNEFKKVLTELVIGGEKKKEKEQDKTVDQRAIEAVGKKIESPIVEANIRLVVSAPTDAEAKHLLHNLESAFNQFENPGWNRLQWESLKVSKEGDFYRSFSFRLFRENEILPLNLKELSSILHFQTEELTLHSPLKRSTSKSAPPPLNASVTGTLLGINRFQGTEKMVYIKDDDRLRHFYTIGQTGTGKSTLLKNMVIEDIEKGHGVCMIDPHGTDIVDVLANIPEERRDDLIYFDPASVERPMALNMLEYDRHFPEQKTFVVNELFSIFQKLYGKVPESMGPMFEQYFRNATMLVIEDPETGSTLVDVSRVMANRDYRKLKIARCHNPIVVQFWEEIAQKAGGEASLANIVPYITSKFDIFLANDIIRPIVSQEKSSFNFREIMDHQKILLVNLSKGRLGDINANLIGLILVGKILMASLSRVDSVGKDLPAFYLYIDEFQNITTNSIATILSEARKYKLSLNIAHQYIAQLEEDIKNAVFGNVGSICAFRVGADDAKYLESQFAPIFSADDLINVDNRKAFLKLLVDGRPVSPFDIETLPPKAGHKEAVSDLINLSKQKYGRDRIEVENEIKEKYKKPDPLNPIKILPLP